MSQISMPTNVVLSSVSGTLWKGNVANVKYLNIDLGELSWKLHPLSLLAGNLSADVFLGSGEEYLKSEVEMTISGKIKLEETRFSMKLSSLQPLSYGMPMAYAGKIEGYLPVSYIQKN
ncbi:MAG: type II secretion system protein N, partial [Gammaproteobacteria bacterium]|nr:type II secretion system protein N [Gammaproteobacteria bacterium]